MLTAGVMPALHVRSSSRRNDSQSIRSSLVNGSSTAEIPSIVRPGRNAGICIIVFLSVADGLFPDGIDPWRLREQPSVNADRLAGDERRFGRREKDDRIRDVLRRADSPQRRDAGKRAGVILQL